MDASTIGPFQGIHPLAMKQFTIAVLFLVSLVAQGRAGLVVCTAGTSAWNAGAGTDKCEEIIKNNRDSKDPAPIVHGRATFTQDDCVIFTNGDGVTRQELALQAQVIVDACGKNGYVAGQINGPTPNPVCIVHKGKYVIFSFGFNGLTEPFVRTSEGIPGFSCLRPLPNTQTVIFSPSMS